MNKLKVVDITKSKASENGDNVVERLEQAIEFTKENNISNVMVVMVTSDGAVIDCFANNNDPFLMLGAIESVKTDFANIAIERRGYD